MFAFPIRDAVDGDGPQIAALIAAVFSEYPGCPFVPDEFPELRAPASHYRRKGGGLWVMTGPEGEVVGSVALSRVDGGPAFEINKVYLASGLRGGGHAHRLMETAEAAALAGGGTELRLWTDTRFTRGHAFYEKLGFRRLPVVRYLADATRAWEFAYVRAIAR
ncbi:GNAT family N-acetyltransferase [Chthonobacter rhizosphaerae]|uniref:GNAT family N-acetyltransferase n=1 Tax=Chthonobacter rhizosphaerae TaxID=2735553 RepID=UPI0015EE5E4C|nr:GNAT family N-acetyltransferase [Chthonobacter rhizosphaerae]